MRIDDSSIRVNRNTCIACGICVDRCIMDNLRLSVAPCRQACPLDMNCQGFTRLLALGKEDEALAQVRQYGPFLKVIAEGCSAPCEKACSRRKDDGAVAILGLTRYLADAHADTLSEIEIAAEPSGKSLAVLGQDVTGLACAMRAVQSGHTVTVISGEQDENLAAVVSSLEKAGVAFCSLDGVEIGTHDAVIVSSKERGVQMRREISDVDPVSHQVTDSLFCADSGSAGKSTAHAVAEAFETIESVNRFFRNEPLNWGRGKYTQDGRVKEFRVDTRVGSDAAPGEVKDAETAREQAGRCYGCGRAFEKNHTCWYCLPCEIECPQQALEVRVPYLVR